MSSRDDLREQIQRRLALDNQMVTLGTVASALRTEGVVLGHEALLDLAESIKSDLTGLGILEPLLSDKAITDILVDGAAQVCVDRGHGIEPTDYKFENDAQVRALAQRLALSVGRRLDQSSPFVDARLESGIRLHACLFPISKPGTSISLRIPRAKTFQLNELVELGSISEEIKEILKSIIEKKFSFVISGGTGSGKTTLLNTMLSECEENERILIVEDSNELKPTNKYKISLEGRPANLEGKGAITMRDLIRQALRMRPDRLIVGEVRGGEVIDWLAALNTGHDGGGGTLHANSPQDVPVRFESLALAAGLNREGLHAQLNSGIQYVIHISRTSEAKRIISSIGRCELDEKGFVRVKNICTFDGINTKTIENIAA